MKKVNLKIVLIITAMALFVSNYSICEYFYPENTKEALKGWWYMKSNIYAIIMALIFLSYNIGTRGFLRFVLSVGIGFAVSNVIDKIYFDIRSFTTADVFMIIITVLFGLFDWYRKSEYIKKK